jgi:uncharacterized glyoxalase superfamily protein PhnB
MTSVRHSSGARADERRRSLIEAADALYEQLKEKGLPVTDPPEAKGWGDYTFVMYDPDGNCLEFSRPRNVSAGSWT